ncbi:hypothetical protein [Commensalibacter papalotli (ex Botero et al. 2024)]|nr:hypothetical protein [Commensalibacter papalotli (ex Botero et al. 2024)]
MISPNMSKKCHAPLFNPDSDDAIQEMARRRSELKIIVTTGLGSDVDRYVSQSPTLIRQVTQLKHDNWQFVWGAAGKGTTTQRPNKDQRLEAKIIIASEFRSDKATTIAQATSSVAHEVGHALFFKGYNFSSVENCIDNYMIGKGGEADAIVNQIIVRAEILQTACIDIFAEAREPDSLRIDMIQYYRDGLRTNDMKTAKRKIADLYSEKYTSNTNPPQKYKDYYGNSCRDAIKAFRKI